MGLKHLIGLGFEVWDLATQDILMRIEMWEFKSWQPHYIQNLYKSHLRE